MHWGRLGIVAIALCVGCAASDPGFSGETSGTTGVGETAADSQTGSTSDPTQTSEDVPPDAPPPSTACAEPTDLRAAPASIGEAIAFINTLPQPVSLDCFLERLERPLSLSATDSVVSLQPAVGVRSPRVFVFYGDLIMSVAIDGFPGTSLLEFGELVGPTASIKGELEFPIEETIEQSAPLERVLDPQGGSKCRLCHGSEVEAPEYEFAFSSDALQHRSQEEVTVASLREQYETCSSIVEGDRCARLDALFGWGEVVQGRFPDQLQTIYDYE